MVIKQHTLCAVCRRPCELGSCVTDEWGRAVHASCYQKKVTKGNSNAPGGYEEVEEILQQTRELREIADQLIKEIGSPDKSLQTAHRPGQAPSAREGGTYASAQSITITDSTAGAIIYYTTDGSTPTTSSAKYSGAITVLSTS